jgi:hypothetical protein
MKVILSRIEVATKESPVSVFVVYGSPVCVFGRTIQTNNWIRNKRYPFLGTFHKDSNLRELRLQLSKYN